jgi:hypothetical protein
MPKPVQVLLDGTNRSLQQLYRAYNRAYFRDKLDHRIRIVIDRRLKPLRRFRCWVLLHEMNHVYVGPEKEHGHAFDGGIFRLVRVGAFAGLW